jgi:hypothetical protein
MLVIQQLGRMRRLPIVILAGLALMALGGLLDVAVHAVAAGHHAHGRAGSEHLAHLVGITGMSLVLAGVVIHGTRRHRRRPRAANHGGLSGNAHR